MEHEEEQHGGDWVPVSAEEEKSGCGAVPQERARLWALVLEARYLPFQLEQCEAGWHLLVPARLQRTAQEELTLFERENRNWPPPEPPGRPLVENTLANLSVLILLATFHNITRLDVPFFGHPAPDWIELGSADAGKISSGEWWRMITALTLHADWLHLAGNLAIGGLFIILLCREIGSGLGWLLILGAGALGNLLNAWLQPPEHSSVGASTAVFGAVGILAATNLVRYRHRLAKRWAMPVAAAVALLALLGSEGKNTDLGAHLFGLLFGTALGLVAEWLMERRGRPRRQLNALLALLAGCLVIAAWWQALYHAG